ncbi:hypothetical protein EV182_004099 [Spiromyces aspiralis]|uniref:Uncharacterized protein n=1 Tax=Spiromyces aspiralis TaxID=68401 RepID=A0ACC1HJE7_9FUNG|nr:hypothetical protein EV182_004099 [Spiromyces aspiralis]
MDAAQVDNIDDQGGAEGLQILIDFHREDRNNGEGNAPHDQEGQLQEQRPLGGMWRRRLMPRKLSFKYFALALYSPTIAMACGSLLARIPLVRALFPQKFYQTVLGGLTFAVTRDFLRVLYSYLSYRIRNSRRIV